METINIAFCCDDKYADKMAVTMLSAAENTKRTLAFYVVDCGILEESKQFVFELQKRYSNIEKIAFKEVKKNDVLENFPIASHFTSSVFYRLFIPNMFPNINRTIYLDCDIIVERDIEELWEVDLCNKPFGAVHEEGNFFNVEDFWEKKHTVGVPMTNRYFNSGVLLIDCKRFLDCQIFNKVVQFVSERRQALPCPEQDAMNIIFSSKEVCSLSPAFNFTPFCPCSKHCFYKTIHRHPVVVHYSMGKPWEFNKNFVRLLHKIKIFKYSVNFLILYWKYSEKIDANMYHCKSMRSSMKFFYKKTMQPIEYFVSKKIKNRICMFFQKFFKNKHE